MADRTCVKCNTTFNYPSVLRAHMKKSARCKDIIEPIPETIEPIPELILEPIIKPVIENIPTNKCNLCNKTFQRKSSLVRHQKETICIKPETLISSPLPAIPPSAIPETPAIPLPVAIPLPPQNMEGIYLVHTREFVNSNKPIYKIGRSSNIVNRTKQYPNGSNVICMLCCENSVECEAKLIELFKVKFTQETFYGKEYFSGNKYDMIKQIFNYISSRYEISF